MSTVTQTGGTRAFSAGGARRRDLVELAVTYGLILTGCWTPRPVQRTLFWISLAWIAGILLARREDWKNLGLGLRGSIRSLWLLAAVLGLSGVAIAVAGSLHTLHGFHLSLEGQRVFWSRAWGYLLWALLQQLVLQDVVLLRLLRLMPSKRRAVVIAAALFASAHLPNPLLVALTVVWGAVACVLFLRYRGLFTLGVAHGLLGLCVALTVPNAVDRHMRVGLGYLAYHPRHARHFRGEARFRE